MCALLSCTRVPASNQTGTGGWRSLHSEQCTRGEAAAVQRQPAHKFSSLRTHGVDGPGLVCVGDDVLHRVTDLQRGLAGDGGGGHLDGGLTGDVTCNGQQSVVDTRG